MEYKNIRFTQCKKEGRKYLVFFQDTWYSTPQIEDFRLSKYREVNLLSKEYDIIVKDKEILFIELSEENISSEEEDNFSDEYCPVYSDVDCSDGEDDPGFR